MNWKYHRQLTLPLLDSRLAECITSGRTLTSMVSIDDSRVYLVSCLMTNYNVLH